MTGSHSSLECDLLEQADPGALVQAIANLRELRTTTGGVNLLVGFRPSLWRRVAPQELPAGVSEFDQEVRGVDGYSMPATQLVNASKPGPILPSNLHICPEY